MMISGIISPPAFPRAGEDKYSQAGLLLDVNRYAEALALYKEILNSEVPLEDKKRSRIFNNIGYCYFKLNDFEKAYEFYKNALDIDPNYPICLNNYAAVLMNQKKYEEALPYLARAYGIEKNIKVIFNLFAAHYYLNHQKEALAFIEEALRLDEAYTEDRLKTKNIKQRDIDRLKKRIRG